MNRFNRSMSVLLSMIISAAMVFALARPAAAADKLRVGKSSPGSFSFTPLDVGVETGIFKKNGLDLQIIGFSGGTKMQQALAADAIDIAFGSGPEMVLTAKGSPMIAVAMMAGSPRNFSVIVPYKSAARTLDDLKGKKIGVSGNPSLSYFMAAEIALTKGWGANGIVPVVVGGLQSGVVAALRTHQVDAITFDTRVGLQLEKVKEGRLLAPCSDYITHFITHAIYGQDNLVKSNPDALRRFLKGWFETIKFMQAHKATSVRIASRVTGAPPEIESKEYDLLMPKFFSPDGRFSPQNVAAVADSLKLLHAIDKLPDMSKLYTDQYLPK